MCCTERNNVRARVDITGVWLEIGTDEDSVNVGHYAYFFGEERVVQVEEL